MPIILDVTAYLVTLIAAGGRRAPPGRTAASVAAAVNAARQIWAQAQIDFNLPPPREVENALPNAADAVDPSGFFFLASQYRPNHGRISVVFVARFTRPELGGGRPRNTAVCVLPAMNDIGSGKMLAHEIGHILGLGHEDQDANNLMFPAARADDQLRQDQRDRARQAAQALGGRTS